MKKLDRSVIQRQPVLAEQVAHLMTQSIRNGDLSPGDVFPSESQLSKELDVSRTVVREALARMKHDGLLESRKGGRTRVTQDISGLVFRIDVDAYKEDQFLKHLYELRVIIEPEAAALAAVRATPEALIRVRTKFKLLEKSITEGGEGTEESIGFHKAIMDASGNPHLAEFVNWVDKKIWAFVRSCDMESNGKMINHIQQEHKSIVEALENRDAQKARETSRKHVLQAAGHHGVKLS
ncbi:MAG: FadR family transcriptional regulator [Calditrichaeota bacterium]|nr:FadR family transcriptional regulator [Calditrichota bacterium]